MAWPLHASQAQQERLYRAASESRDLNNRSRMSRDMRSYAVATNNCGSWARKMIESNGLTWPEEASEYNMGGAGVGGIQDELPFSTMVTGLAAAYGCTFGRVVQETGGEYFMEGLGDDGIVGGVRWRF